MAQNTITAVAFRGRIVEWTTVRTAKGRVEVVETRSEELPVPAGTFTGPEFADAIRTAVGHLSGRVCVALPSDRSLMRVVDLPTTDSDEMEGMVDLQVDKFSPFPVEQMGVSYEVLSQAPDSSRVLIGAVQRDLIDALGDAFRQVNVLPHWMDIDVMGWWWLLKDAGEIPEEGRRVMLILEPGSAELVICEGGVPLVLRSLGTAAGVSKDEYYAELADEVGYSLTTLEADRGVAMEASIALWHRGGEGAETPAEDAEAPPAEDEPGAPPKLTVQGTPRKPDPGIGGLVTRLREACGAEVQTRRLEDLPPVSEGLARRTAKRKGGRLDLTPESWHSEEESRKTRKALILATVVFLLLWVGGMSAFIGGLTVERNQLADARKEVEALEGPAEEVRLLQDRIQSFEDYADRTHSALEALREIVVVLPASVELTSFNFKKGDSVNVRGFATQPGPIYDFFSGLEQSDFFTEVDPGDVRSRMIAGRQKSEFTVSVDLPREEEEEETL